MVPGHVMVVLRIALVYCLVLLDRQCEADGGLMIRHGRSRVRHSSEHVGSHTRWSQAHPSKGQRTQSADSYADDSNGNSNEINSPDLTSPDLLNITQLQAGVTALPLLNAVPAAPPKGGRIIRLSGGNSLYTGKQYHPHPVRFYAHKQIESKYKILKLTEAGLMNLEPSVEDRDSRKPEGGNDNRSTANNDRVIGGGKQLPESRLRQTRDRLVDVVMLTDEEPRQNEATGMAANANIRNNGNHNSSLTSHDLISNHVLKAFPPKMKQKILTGNNGDIKSPDLAADIARSNHSNDNNIANNNNKSDSNKNIDNNSNNSSSTSADKRIISSDEEVRVLEHNNAEFLKPAINNNIGVVDGGDEDTVPDGLNRTAMSVSTVETFSRAASDDVATDKISVNEIDYEGNVTRRRGVIEMDAEQVVSPDHGSRAISVNGNATSSTENTTFDDYNKNILTEQSLNKSRPEGGMMMVVQSVERASAAAIENGTTTESISRAKIPAQSVEEAVTLDKINGTGDSVNESLSADSYYQDRSGPEPDYGDRQNETTGDEEDTTISADGQQWDDETGVTPSNLFAEFEEFDNEGRSLMGAELGGSVRPADTSIMMTVEGDVDFDETSRNNRLNLKGGHDTLSQFLQVVETQHLMGSNCTAGTALNLGEGVVDRYAQERFRVEAEIAVNRANMLTR